MCGMCTNAEKVLEKEGEKSSPHGIGRSTNSLGLDTSGTSSLVFLRLSHTRLRRWVGLPSFTSSDSPGEMEASPLSGQPGLAGRLLLPRLRNILVPQVCPSPQWEHRRAGLVRLLALQPSRLCPDSWASPIHGQSLDLPAKTLNLERESVLGNASSQWAPHPWD